MNTFINFNEINLGEGLDSKRTGYFEGGWLAFCGCLLVNVSWMETKFNWPEVILLVLNECSIAANRLEIEDSETWEKFSPRGSMFCWESMKECEEILTVVFWISGEMGEAGGFELSDENFLFKIVLWQADWNSM